MNDNREKKEFTADIELSENDIYEAMKDIRGYLDVTPADLKELYKFAYRHAWNRITRHIKASDIMTRKVLSVERTTTIKETAELMAEHDIYGVPVIDSDGKVSGVISEKDFLSRLGIKGKVHFVSVIAACATRACYEIILSQNAEDIMTAPAITVREETTAGEISNIMAEKNINRVPVTDSEGKLIGIVSRSDIVRALSTMRS